MTLRIKSAITSLLLYGMSLFLPFFSTRINRVSPEETYYLTDSVLPFRFILLLPPLLLGLNALMNRRKGGNIPAALAGTLGLLFPLFMLSLLADSAFVAELGPFGRVNPASGLYLYMAASAVVFLMKERLSTLDKVGLLLVLGAIVSLGLTGRFAHFGIIREAINFGTRLPREIIHHLRITFISVGISLVIGLPAALASFQFKPVRAVVIPFLNTLQTIPGIALFGLLIAPLALISRTFPLLRELGIRGIGDTPAIIALSTYALYPVIRYSITAFESADPRVIDAADGMGMSPSQLWRMVRLPLAAPGVLHGIRTALIQTLGNATLAKLIGGGGLGVLVFEGLGQASTDMVLLGMLLVIALTLVSDRILQGAIHILTPVPLRKSSVGRESSHGA